jgi:hypothetical protein
VRHPHLAFLALARTRARTLQHAAPTLRSHD